MVSRFHGRPYRCLLWSHGSEVPERERRAIARVLLVTGCRYVVCGGADCETWHDTVDEEWIQQNLPDLDAALEGDSTPPSVLLNVGDGPARKLLREALAQEGLRLPTDESG